MRAHGPFPRPAPLNGLGRGVLFDIPCHWPISAKIKPVSEARAPRQNTSDVAFFDLCVPSLRTPCPTPIASRRDVGPYPHPAATPHLLLCSPPSSQVLMFLFLPRISAASGRLPKVPPFHSASGRAHNNLSPISP